jgi:ABC-type oligopeptide transport system substrate-binding subunit
MCRVRRATVADRHGHAADVLFTFDLLKQKGRPPVRFDLSGLDSQMPLTLAMMPVLPKHATDVEDFDNPTLKPPVGSGPYVIADVQPGVRLILRRNPDYWAQDLPVQRGLFNFDEIEIDYYREADSSFEAFEAGLCDFRQETDAGRWIRSYDFPAVRDGRTSRPAQMARSSVAGHPCRDHRSVRSRRYAWMFILLTWVRDPRHRVSSAT